MTQADLGLCGGCRFQRAVPNTRGSLFSLCERSREEPSFARYPKLPVAICTGFAPRAAEAAGRDEDEPD